MRYCIIIVLLYACSFDGPTQAEISVSGTWQEQDTKTVWVMDESGVFREFDSVLDNCYTKLGVWEIYDDKTLHLMAIPYEHASSESLLIGFAIKGSLLELTIDGQTTMWESIPTKTPLWSEQEYHCWNQ